MRQNWPGTACSPLQDVPTEQMNAHHCRVSEFARSARSLTMRVEVFVESKIEMINPVVIKLMRLLRRTCWGAEHEFAVETALREALANAIVHGNHGDTNKKVRVRCECDSAQGIRITIKDEGVGFDPAYLPSPVAGEYLDSDHGRGIFLIKKLMDETHFEDGGREIHMRKGGSSSH
jgi:serine/threonine-protein kinase RsbW